MARILLVGCGCRGGELAVALAQAGHVVRGTTRREEGLAAIDATGTEAVLADPDRLSTLLDHLDGVSAMCWLMGAASGDEQDVAALHGPRLESIATKLVDTHVRGLVYEASGTVGRARLAEGAATVRRVGASNRMPVAVVRQDPGDMGAWTTAMTDAVARVLSA